jgi:hypothetical protein
MRMRETRAKNTLLCPTKTQVGYKPTRRVLVVFWMLLSTAASCRSDCVSRCGLDPVEEDLKRFKAQRRELHAQRGKLMQRVREFEDKVFVNQRAALDLLRTDLTQRAARFVRKFAGVEIETRTVGRVYKKELNGYEKLARAYSVLQTAFETNDAELIRKGLHLRKEGLLMLEGAEEARDRLERKYWRNPRRR